jgi:hypothetical protein
MTKDHPGLTWAFSQAAAQGKDNVDDSDDDPTAALAPFGFPVLMITLSDNSLEVEELVKVTPGVQSPDLFRVPAGYTKRTIPGMPGR